MEHRRTNSGPAPSFDASLNDAFQAFTDTFRPFFRRHDQWVRFQAYVGGLLAWAPRKHVEGIAQAVSGLVNIEANLAQALQHFITLSPWDERSVLTHLRSLSRSQRDDPAAVWFVHDVVFPKKGRHSVGVQRQLARSLGRKINCQVGVMVSQMGPHGFFPLVAQLYLPASWLREQPEIRLHLLPDDQREPQSKANIAMSLLKHLQDTSDVVRPIAAEAGYQTMTDFSEGLRQHGFTWQHERSAWCDRVAIGVEWLNTHLGLDHFEGRTWHGWHRHVCLVLVAYHFWVQQGWVFGRSQA